MKYGIGIFAFLIACGPGDDDEMTLDAGVTPDGEVVPDADPLTPDADVPDADLDAPDAAPVADATPGAPDAAPLPDAAPSANVDWPGYHQITWMPLSKTCTGTYPPQSQDVFWVVAEFPSSDAHAYRYNSANPMDISDKQIYFQFTWHGVGFTDIKDVDSQVTCGTGCSIVTFTPVETGVNTWSATYERKYNNTSSEPGKPCSYFYTLSGLKI